MTRFPIPAGLALATLLFGGRADVPTSTSGPVHSIVEMSEHCLIGGVQNQRWVRAGQFQKTFKSPGTFTLYTLQGRVGEVTLHRNAESECQESWAGKTATDSQSGIAIQSPSWNVMPRLPQRIDPKDPADVQVVGDILKGEGIPKPDVEITQAYKVDLDGDGKDETVIVANRYAQGLNELSGVANETSAGDYTLVVIVKIIDGKSQNIILAHGVWLSGNQGPLPRANHLSAIADLNGDGVMELVFYDAYHEGSGSVVIQLKGSRATMVLECSCEH
jgi:hypothetical protein